MPLPKILVEVFEDERGARVRVRGDQPIRVAVVNRPRLAKLKALAPATFVDTLMRATRFIRRERAAVATRRDALVDELGAGERPVEETRTYRVPVTSFIEVEAASEDEARSLALEQAENDDATAGDPTVVTE